MKRCFIFLLFFIVLFSSFSWGNQMVRPYPYKVNTENGRYVFYMIPPRYYPTPQYKDLRLPTTSGLYQADGQGFSIGEPLWRVHWYAYKIFLSEDGQYLARLGGPVKKENQMALAFYREGQLIKQYLLSDLMPPKAQIIRNSSRILWMKKSQFDGKNNFLVLLTLWQDQCTFALTSGEMVGKDRIPFVPEEKNPSTGKPNSSSAPTTSPSAPPKTPSPKKTESPPDPSSTGRDGGLAIIIALLVLVAGGVVVYYKVRK